MGVPERDYIERTIATVRNHAWSENSWTQWANIFANEIERLWAIQDAVVGSYLCENCGRLGPLNSFNDDCTPGWTHGRMIRVQSLGYKD